MLHIHLLNSLNSLFLLLVNGSTAVGTKEIKYLTVLDLGPLILPLCLISLLSNSGLSGCVLSCKMPISISCPFMVQCFTGVLCLPNDPSYPSF